MPRRGGGGLGRSRSPAPARAPSPRSTAVAPPPPSAPAPMAAQPRQPGLMAQMAATAGGVAIGSAVGHTIGHAMTGGLSGGGAQAVEAAPAQPVQSHAPQQSEGVCAIELRQLIECSQTQSDLSLCAGFNEALRECRLKNGVTLQ